MSHAPETFEDAAIDQLEHAVACLTQERDAALKRAEAAEAEGAVLVTALKEAGRSLELGANRLLNVHAIAAHELNLADQRAFYAVTNRAPQAQALLDRVRGMEDAIAALGFGTETDADQNLGGAIIDIERTTDAYTGKWECDDVCMRTLKRVEAQLGRAASAISKSAAGA